MNKTLQYAWNSNSTSLRIIINPYFCFFWKWTNKFFSPTHHEFVMTNIVLEIERVRQNSRWIDTQGAEISWCGISSYNLKRDPCFRFTSFSNVNFYMVSKGLQLWEGNDNEPTDELYTNRVRKRGIKKEKLVIDWV